MRKVKNIPPNFQVSEKPVYTKECGWGMCTKKISDELFACWGHWKQLPEEFKDKLRKTDVTSPAYVAAVAEITAWIKTVENEQ